MEKELGKFLTKIKNYPVVGEENSFENSSKWPPKKKNFWLVDPIDGTHNFLGENPNFGSIVALIENREVVFGAIYIFAEHKLSVPGQLYFAGRDSGARKFSRDGYLISLTVSNVREIKNATLLVEGVSKTVVRSRFIQRIWKKAKRFYKGLSSSVALAKIANGGNATLSADILIMRGNKPWDSLAGALIVEEAGGIVTSSDGRPYSLKNYSDLIYTNKILHPKILALR
ncbi:MAG: 3-Phosphoadenosine 5-phosphosulfate (PAPS) 3-phosphatase [Parcubacteria group bacterium GW2011_GWA2_44_13]|nr:MAG: 3-Phosphoadenosine 5-phosphosulfate (PAPS) 3-phosphatase [Parcubacteria group bacterium GW2011_GWA2_44_13]